MSKKGKKGRSTDGGLIYSTHDHFGEEEEYDESYPDPSEQTIYVRLDRKMRKGKTVVLIEGIEASDSDLKDIAKELKSLCGSGGSVKDETIIIQGDKLPKCVEFLEKSGYNVRKIGG